MVKLLKKYLYPYRWQVACVLLFVALQVLCELALPTIMADIVDFGLVEGGMPYIIRRGLLMLAMSVGQVATMIGVGYLSARVSSGFGRDLRRDIFVKSESFSLTEMNKLSVSSMIVRNTNDVTMLQNFSVMFMRMVLTAPTMCIGSIILTTKINKELSKIVLFAVPFLILMFLLIIIFASKLIKILRERVDKLNLLLREHLSGTRVIRAFVNQKTEQEKFDEGNEGVFIISRKINRITSSMMPCLMMIINITTVLVCVIGAKQIEFGNLKVGQMMSCITYVTQILSSLAMLSMLMVIIPRAQISSKRINEVLEMENAIKEPENPLKPAKANGRIEFKNVTFSYEGGDAPVLTDVNFTAEPGQTTAIVGSTGSGKTTLLALLNRLYDVNEGSILLDGQNLRDFDSKDLRSRLGYVPQKGVLFTGSIADNVRFGFPDATDEQVEKALKTAQAWEFVSTMEQGVESPISQGGKNVSGGQKQRLAIARAIVKPCEAYIFDDSFSALDFATDAKLRLALKNDEEINKSTVLIVAQRISTVMNADKIIVMDNGKVAGIGKHKDLLKNCPLYYEIASSQLSEEELR